MPLSQAVSFLYQSQPIGTSAERANLRGPLIIRTLQTWKITDKLNKLNQLIITVFKADVDRNDIYLERDVFVPVFGFTGIITGLIDVNDSILKIVMTEEAWHFTRRLYKIADSLKEYNIALVAPASLPDLLEDLIGSANTDMPILNETEIPGLISLWRLNSTPDDDKGVNDGTWSGTPDYVDGKFYNDKAAKFNGVEYITTADAPFDFDRTSPFSIVFLIKFKSGSAFIPVSKMLSNNTIGFDVRINTGGNVRLRLINTNTTDELDYQSSLNIGDNIRHTVILTTDGTGTVAGSKIIIDGIEDKNATAIIDNLVSTILNNELLTLGAYADGSEANTFEEDDVRIYNRAITVKEAEKLHLQTQSGIDTIIQRIDWKLGEGDSLEISDLVALLQFNDDLLDAKGTNNGTSSGSETYVDGLKYGKAFSFAGQFITLDNPSNFDREINQPFSISLWIKNVNTGSDILVAKATDLTTIGYTLIQRGAGLEFQLHNGTTAYSVVGVADTSEGTLHHIVATYSGNSNQDGLKIYVDKILDATGSSLAITGSILNALAVTIGAGNAGASGHVGDADDFRFYNKELNLEEITRLFEAKNSFIDKIRNDEVPATTNINFDVKWKSYHDVLRQIALNSVNDVWFENNRVLFGTRGKTFILDRNDKIYEKLSTKIDLDVYGNIVNVVGAKSGGTNLHSQVQAAETDLLYNYERVVSNNSLTTQAAVDGVTARVLEDFDSIQPDVKIDIRDETIHKYGMESGDIIKIISNSETQTVKGFFRLIEVVSSNTRSLIKLQFSKTGKFIPRISDSLSILEAALIKIHDVELNS